MRSRITADEVEMIQEFGQAMWDHDANRGITIIKALIKSFEGEDVLEEITAKVEAKLGRSRPPLS